MFGGTPALFIPRAALDELLQQPGGGRTGRGIAAINRRQAIGGAGKIRHGESHQRARSEIGLDHGERHVAPADALAQQGVFRAEIGETPGSPAHDAEVAPLRQRRAVGQHQLDVVAPRAGRRGLPARASGWSGAATGINSTDPTATRSISSFSAASGPLTPSTARRSSTRPVTAPSASTDSRNGHGRKFFAEVRSTSPSRAMGSMTSTARRTSDSSPSSMPLTLARNPSTPCRDGPRFRQHGPSRFGQARAPGGFTVEQFDAELGFQIGDAIADDRGRAIELAARGGETAVLDDRQKDLELIESGDAWILTFLFHRMSVRIYPTYPKRAKALHKLPEQSAVASKEDIR